ncbi:MAG: hypothetical protein OEM49_10885 [Myxococcales bacterium]|nr:hypothetical protein [Myxococcales bacterium]MDH5307340.1 hypothetical protein [Myxococcales bacterium]MDH5565031.1 hypothetical protein [Myxococcales bacterium]
MRIKRLAALALLLLLLAPSGAAADEQARCRYYEVQIAHFETMSKRADALENDEWVDRLDTHLSSLKQSQKSCPGHSDSEVAARQMQELFKLAARGAVTFFTMGMVPF